MLTTRLLGPGDEQILVMLAEEEQFMELSLV